MIEWMIVELVLFSVLIAFGGISSYLCAKGDSND